MYVYGEPRKMIHNCRVCEVELDDENWYMSLWESKNYICIECYKEKQRLHRKNNPDKVNERNRAWREANPEKTKAQNIRANRKRGVLPMSENKECAAYLGVHINERVLRHLFNDVEVMPYGNKGYDFVCNHGKKIDAKSSCLRKAGNWSFRIDHNKTADYFLLVAYDNRTDVNPLYAWLIPGDVLNHLALASIRESTLDKWSKYEQPIDDLIICCDMIRGN